MRPILLVAALVKASHATLGMARLIVILSRQRSSSSNLAVLLGGLRNSRFAARTGTVGPCLRCITNFNEISDRGYPSQDAGASLFVGGTHGELGLLQYALAVRNAVCSGRTIAGADGTTWPPQGRGCEAHDDACAITFKLFDSHSIPMNQLRELLEYQGTAAIVLERDAHDEECSLRWAEQSGDFSITPAFRENRKSPTNYEAFRRRCKATSAFSRAHNSWFEHVRKTLREVQRPWLEVRFEEATANASATLARISAFSRSPVVRSPGCLGLDGNGGVPQSVDLPPPPPRLPPGAREPLLASPSRECKPWCEATTVDWLTKCTWPKNQCAACSFCEAVIPPSAPMPLSSPPSPLPPSPSPLPPSPLPPSPPSLSLPASPPVSSSSPIILAIPETTRPSSASAFAAAQAAAGGDHREPAITESEPFTNSQRVTLRVGGGLLSLYLVVCCLSSFAFYLGCSLCLRCGQRAPPQPPSPEEDDSEDGAHDRGSDGGTNNRARGGRRAVAAAAAAAASLPPQAVAACISNSRRRGAGERKSSRFSQLEDAEDEKEEEEEEEEEQGVELAGLPGGAEHKICTI